MSLYEQFHSDINKQHMFNLIKTYLQKEKNIDISTDKESNDFFLSSLSIVFEKNNADELEEMNQYLLEYNVEHFVNKNKTNLEPILKDDFEKLLQEREKQDIMSNSSKDSSDNISYDIKEVNADDNLEIYEKPIVKIPTPVETVIPKKESVEKILPLVHINSSKRTSINSSRYNYKIDLSKNNININDLSFISKMVIPIEDNYIFSIPVIVLTINELNCNIHMQQSEIIEGNNRNYGIYKPLEKHNLNPVNNSSRITVDIRDVSEKRYISSDILKINIIEFRNNRIYFTCSSIHKLDYQTGDYIKVINNNSHNSLFHIFQEPLKIKKIQENVVVCEYRGFDEIDDRIFTNIDMKIMNMSNQNILYFN
tara:strand:+ start:148 stop:1248 length:1101 start_codon:yes stop_codon:yes gene_type:complete